MKRCVSSFERNNDRDDELRVSGGKEFQSRGAMTEKSLLPIDVPIYGMDGGMAWGQSKPSSSDSSLDISLAKHNGSQSVN